MRGRCRTLVVSAGTAGEALASAVAGGRSSCGHDALRPGRNRSGRAQQYLIYFVNFELGGMDGVELMKEIRRVQPEASIIVTWRGPALAKTNSSP